MVHCVANGCTNDAKNTVQNKEQNITFHRFPKNIAKKKLWINAVRRKDWNPSDRSYLCSQHFKESDIDRTSLCCVRLRDGALPEIFSGHRAHLQEVVKDSRPPKLIALEEPIRLPSKLMLVVKKSKVHVHEITDELEETQTRLDKSEQKVVALEKKVKLLQQQKRRLTKQLTNLNGIINLLMN